ncbi:MAG: protein kinase [Deltaproteobacteria bacterium]|nr:protein kinase [Deltaproteobacteria bacterium]
MTEVVPIEQHDPFSAGLIGKRLGRYEILTRLASGGMAAIYVARAVGVAGFERLFAIKVLHPHLAYEHEFVAMFLDEARLAARIRHPNVISTFEVSDACDAGYYLVMEYVEGDHLGALMREAANARRRLPASVTLRVIVDALNGLGAAHELTDETGAPLHLVHRDISPQNIMVSTDGISRLTDFGVAKAASRISNTKEGQFKGKLAYMAPEHASDGKADQRSDLFAMGTILWECLTGQRLFRADNHAATLTKVCLDPIPMPSSVDPDLATFDNVLESALERDPDKRFQSASEFVDAIEANAAKLDGIAKSRAVSNLVKQYASDKLQKDRDLIKNAIAMIESNGFIPSADATVSLRPQPGAPLVSVPPLPYSIEAAADAQLSGPIPAEPAYEPKETSGSNRMIWVLGSIVIAISAGIGLAFALAGGEQPTRITTSPLDVKPSTITTQAPSTSEGQKPEISAITKPESISEPEPAERIAKPEAERKDETALSEKKPATARRPRFKRSSEIVPPPSAIKPVQPVVKPSEPAVKPTPASAPSKRGKPPQGEEILSNPYR